MLVVTINFGLPGVELIPVDSDVEPNDFTEPNLAVEDLAKASEEPMD